MAIGERLRELRYEHGLSMRDAGALVGAAGGSWSNWENEKNFPMPKMIEAIADAFGVTETWVMTGKGSKTPEEEAKRMEEAKQKKLDEVRNVHSADDEEKLKDINVLMSAIKDLDVPKDRKRHIHRTLSAYRTDLESVVLFGEVR